jgi:hypothetical protein
MKKYKIKNISFFLLLPHWSTGSPWPVLRSVKESRCWERERKSKRGPHRRANEADVEELRSGSSEALGGCVRGELGWTESSQCGCQRGKRRQLQCYVDQLWWRGNNAVRQSSAAAALLLGEAWWLGD